MDILFGAITCRRFRLLLVNIYAKFERYITFIGKVESAKLRALRAHVPTCLACLMAYVPTCLSCLRAHVPTCLAYVLTCQRVLRTHVLTCLTLSCANMPCVLCVPTRSCANMPCMLCVPTYSRVITQITKISFQ